MKKEKLEHLTNDEIRELYLIENWENIKDPIVKDYISKGIDSHDIGRRLNRVERLLSIIVLRRFIDKEIV